MAYRIRPHLGLLGTVYLVAGLFVAWNRGYLTSDLLRRLASALLAVLLWFLILLGADLHVHG